MSIREQEPADFSHSMRGYDRQQVDEYLASVREYTIQVEERARTAESELAQCRRELASSPGTSGISQRLAAILQLAHEEADEVRARATAESEAMTRQAASQAERTVNDANAQRDAVEREIAQLSAVRDELLEGLVELGNKILDATVRFQGSPPGPGARAQREVELFDGESVDDGVAAEAEPVGDPATDTQRFTPTAQTPEHE